MYENKKHNNATRYEKLCLKRYFYEKKFKLKSEEFNIEFISDWYNKEHIFDNILFVIGKSKVKKEDSYY
jgi:hypothetical protein